VKSALGKEVVRCDWARNDLAIAYHDCEWGVPQHDDRILFELLVLEGAQAGLSWDTILRKRGNYRAAPDRFDPKKLSRYDKRKLDSLMRNEGIVRNRLKIVSVVRNARAFSGSAEGVRLIAIYGSLSAASRRSTRGGNSGTRRHGLQSPMR
jgi:DNA-3-methyladenine glycosylase I